MDDQASAFQLFDLHRIFLGDLPWTFTLEVVVCTVIMYLYTFGQLPLPRQKGLRATDLSHFNDVP